VPSVGAWLQEESRSSPRPTLRRRRVPPLSYSQAGERERERVAATRMRLHRRLESLGLKGLCDVYIRGVGVCTAARERESETLIHDYYKHDFIN